jgi:Skp family chaperone for outer membrane proteins
MTRAGLVVAVAGGLMACAFAWREVRVTRTTLMAQQSADSRRSGEKLHAERVQHVRLLQVLQARNGELRSKLNTTRAEAAQLNQEAAQLRGDKVALQVELSEHQAAAEAEVLALPRRVSGRGDVVDLWGVDGAPTVVELQALANPPVPESQLRQQA